MPRLLDAPAVPRTGSGHRKIIPSEHHMKASTTDFARPSNTIAGTVDAQDLDESPEVALAVLQAIRPVKRARLHSPHKLSHVSFRVLRTIDVKR